MQVAWQRERTQLVGKRIRPCSPMRQEGVEMKAYRDVIGAVVLSAACATAACNRDATTDTAANAGISTERTTDIQRERNEAVADLNDRVAKVEREYVENDNQVKSGTRTATAGLREELREDVGNVKEAIADLNTTTAENWWDRHEHAMSRTADDIEADVRRLAGDARFQQKKKEEEVGTKGESVTAAPFTSRRDAFVADLHIRVDAM